MLCYDEVLLRAMTPYFEYVEVDDMILAEVTDVRLPPLRIAERLAYFVLNERRLFYRTICRMRKSLCM